MREFSSSRDFSKFTAKGELTFYQQDNLHLTQPENLNLTQVSYSDVPQNGAAPQQSMSSLRAVEISNSAAQTSSSLEAKKEPVQPLGKDVLVNAFGITSHAKSFDPNTGEVTEIINSQGTVWQRHEKSDQFGYEWRVANPHTSKFLQTTSANFDGEVKQGANGSLIVDTERETYAINQDGSYIHAYRYPQKNGTFKPGAIDTWDPKTSTLQTGMPGETQTLIHYSKDAQSGQLRPVEVDHLKTVDNRVHSTPAYRIDDVGGYHSLQPNDAKRSRTSSDHSHKGEASLHLKNIVRPIDSTSKSNEVKPKSTHSYLTAENAAPVDYYADRKPLW